MNIFHGEAGKPTTGLEDLGLTSHLPESLQLHAMEPLPTKGWVSVPANLEGLVAILMRTYKQELQRSISPMTVLLRQGPPQGSWVLWALVV